LKNVTEKRETFALNFVSLQVCVDKNILKIRTMNTALKRKYSIPFTLEQILDLIRSLPLEDKIIIEKEIERDTLVARAARIDKKVKNNTLTMDDIANEVKIVRKKQHGES